jgi:hypothetical protein
MFISNESNSKNGDFEKNDGYLKFNFKTRISKINVIYGFWLGTWVGNFLFFYLLLNTYNKILFVKGDVLKCLENRQLCFN